MTLAPSADTTAPSAPANLTVTDFDDFCGSQLLEWSQSTDDTDPQSALEYGIYLDGRFFLLTAPGASFAGVYTPSGTNTWTVVAVDSGNSSAPSNAVTLTVHADQNLC